MDSQSYPVEAPYERIESTRCAGRNDVTTRHVTKSDDLLAKARRIEQCEDLDAAATRGI